MTSVLIATTPLTVCAVALALDRRERVDRGRLAGMVAALGGVALLLGVQLGDDARALLGAGLVLAANVSWAAGSLYLKRAFAQARPLGVASAALALTAVAFLPAAAPRLGAMPATPAMLAALLGLSVFCTALAFAAYYALVPLAGATTASLCSYVSPAIGVLAGVALLGDPFGAAGGAGLVLILLGSWRASQPARPRGLTPRRAAPRGAAD
jgi:drug/metabolite transporter (DMT)-like permease